MRRLLFLLLLLSLPSLAFAVTVTPAGQSSNLAVAYVEPTVNFNGTPLTDLLDTHVTYQKPGEPEVECAREPASAFTGGATVNTICAVPAVRGDEFDVDLRAYATDTVLNQSDPSDPVPAHIDRKPPGTPE